MGLKIWLHHILDSSQRFFSCVEKKKVFSKLPSPQVWVLTEDCSDLCISNRLRASISDLCFSFEISPISNLPVLTHWAECLTSQKWQNWPTASNIAAEQRKMYVCSYRWVNNSMGAIHIRTAQIWFFSLSSDSAVCFEVKCSENLVLLLSEAFIPLKRVSFSIEIAATISTSLLFRTEAYSRFVSSKLKHFKHNLA